MSKLQTRAEGPCHRSGRLLELWNGPSAFYCAEAQCIEPETLGLRAVRLIMVDPGGKLWSITGWCLCARPSA